jgi:hypothetical protein
VTGVQTCALPILCRTSYDVHYTYNAKEKKAFYSEEFKDCGNGHYYLAIDNTHALFYEDD